MQQLLASLVVGMSVQDNAFRAAMATNRAEVKRTGQDFDRSADQMGGALQRAAREIDAAAIRVVDSIAKAGRAARDGGLLLTVGLTLPLGTLAAASKKTASDFQSAMNLVHSAMVDASPEELDMLREAALTLGPAVGKSAIEAASGIESLAKNGMSAASILNGGLAAALKLSVVGQTDLSNAADATTDILQQFHLGTSSLPDVVNKVSGALDASKLSFDGYADAIGMVGGIAGGLGYQFDDMNTALAAVIPLMTGGSDAGTSFKTFLLSLVPQSKEAAKEMDALKISFSDAEGNMKSLGEVAEVLNTRLAGLTQEDRQKKLTTMFGTDGMRVALALMQAGAKGIADVQAQIDKASADQKIEILLQGEAAATQRLASAWERLKIAIGEAGILQAFTIIKNAAATVISGIARLPSGFFSVMVAVGAVAASIGPLTLAVLGIAKIALPLLLLRLGPLALGFAAIINPAGVVIRLLAQLAIRAGAGMIIGRLGVAMLGFAGPIGLVITGLMVLYPLLTRTATASDAMRAAVDAARQAEESARDVMLQLANATGKAREEILKKAQADRIAARDAMKKAQADMQAARASYVRAKADAAQASAMGGVGDPEGGINVGAVSANGRLANRAADFQAAIDALDLRIKALGTLNGAIAGANAPVSKIDMSFDDPAKPKKTKDDSERDAARYLDELGRARVAQLRAQADLTDSARARYTADMAEIAEDRAAYARSLALDKDLTQAQRATLLAERDKEAGIRQQIAEQTLSRAQAQETYEIARAANDAEQEATRMAGELADSSEARRDAAMRLLDLQRQQEEADLDLILATKNSATAEWQNAEKRKGQLDDIYAARAEAVKRDTEGPREAYLRSLNKSAGALRDDLDAVKVDALKGLNADLTDALMGTKKLGDAFETMGKRIIASLIDIAVQQRLIKPLAKMMFGDSPSADNGGESAGSGGGGLFGALFSFKGLIHAPASTPGYGGGRATGGPIRADRWYTVGERGPETFAPGVSGTIIPNGGRGDRTRDGGIARIVPSPYFNVVVDRRAAGVAVPVAQASTASGIADAGRANAWRARQSVG